MPELRCAGGWEQVVSESNCYAFMGLGALLLIAIGTLLAAAGVL